MDPVFFSVVRTSWLFGDRSNAKRISQGLCPLGRSAGELTDGCNIQVKFRDTNKELKIDDEARLKLIDSSFYIKSEKLKAFITALGQKQPFVSFFFEGTATDARCIVTPLGAEFFESVKTADPAVRLESFDLPPAKCTLVDSDRLVGALYRTVSSRDSQLFAVHASRFLDAPHIITALFAHVFTIGAEDNIKFPTKVKKLAEQLRSLLTSTKSSVCIRAVKKSHLHLWSEVQGQRFAFLDGGVARIPPSAGMEPSALRVGVYSVRPGISEPDEREQWRMEPYILGDLVDHQRPTRDSPDARRFQEAARYTLEPLTGLRHLEEFPDTRVLLLHGPLVTQFLQYDEGPPNYLPYILPKFLAKFQIDESTVAKTIKSIPETGGQSDWNQFMAIYGYTLRAVDRSKTPIAGVIERPTGRFVTISILESLQRDGIVNEAYVEHVQKELKRYDITDDFLFGCVLDEGEYITPVRIQKNRIHGARDKWQPVVKQFLQPKTFLLKTTDMNFPFRIEANEAAAADVDFLARFLYHTARLLPRYAFPVGLDIADKYARVPDWISRGISSELSAAILRRALKTGDAKLVTQIRLLLARDPRDFFYRPTSRI